MCFKDFLVSRDHGMEPLDPFGIDLHGSCLLFHQRCFFKFVGQGETTRITNDTRTEAILYQILLLRCFQ